MTHTIQVYLDLCRQVEDARLAFDMARMMKVSRVCPVSDAVQNLIEMEFQEAKRRLEQLRERKRAARGALIRQAALIALVSALATVWFLNL